MKWSDNEEAQAEYEEEVKGYPEKVKREKEWEKEILQEKINDLLLKQKKVNKETARLWKNRRNRRDYLLHKNLMGKEEKISEEIFYLTLVLKKGKNDVYRAGVNSCYYVNKPFKGCVKHHIDKNTIVCVPLNLHLTVKHNLKSGKGMKEINENVFRWLRQENNDSSR